MVVLEVAEDGTLKLPAEVIGKARPHTRFLVERQSEGLLLRPESGESGPEDDNWLAEWDALSEAVTAAWQGDKGAVESVSEMRR